MHSSSWHARVGLLALVSSICALCAFRAAADLYVTSARTNALHRYSATTGAFLATIVDGVDSSIGLPSSIFSNYDTPGIWYVAVGPDGKIYFSDFAGNTIYRRDAVAGTVEPFVSVSGFYPLSFTWAPNGDLYVITRYPGTGGPGLVRIDGSTGAYSDVDFIRPDGDAGGIAFEPSGDVLYISLRNDFLLRYFTTTNNWGSRPEVEFAEQILRGPDDLLYVSRGSGPILRFLWDGTPFGAGGNTLDPTFTSGGSMSYAASMAFGPDGNLYVADYLNNNVCRFRGDTGVFIDVFTQPGSLIDGCYGLAFEQGVGSGVWLDLAGGPYTATGVRLVFTSLDVPGTTSITGLGPVTPPDGYIQALGFDISTTVGYTAPITVCVNYSTASLSDADGDGDVDAADEALLRLYHDAGAGWTNVTLPVAPDGGPNPDTARKVIYGQVMNFSPFMVAAPLPILPVSIDIKPGETPNTIKLGTSGNVPVAIFSTPDFDARTIDPLTVKLAGANVKLKGNGTPQVSVQDVNGDGRPDLIVHVSTEALQLTSTDTQAILTGRTTDNRRIQGTDTVRVIP